MKYLEGQGKRIVRAEMIEPLKIGREFTEWVELILGTSEVCDCRVIIYLNLTISVTGRI